MKMSSSLLPAFALISLGMLPQQTSAAEIAGVDILQGGKNIAGIATTYDDETHVELWYLMKGNPLTVERDFQMPVNPDNKSATLKGKIEVQIQRRNRPLKSVLLKKLDLVKKAGRWYVKPSEVKRTAKLAGLE